MNHLFANIDGGADLDNYLDKMRACRNCDSWYTERANIGRWRCLGYHPLRRFASPHEQTLPCCDGKCDSPGCVRADHTDVILLEDGKRTITRQQLALLDVPSMIQSQSWRANGNGGYTVYRVEPDGFAAAVNVNCSAPDPALLVPPLVFSQSSKVW